MARPHLSEHYRHREPSSIRLAQIAFSMREDPVRAINLAIGNVSLPMHPAMLSRMRGLGDAGSPFERGVVGYTATRGTEEANAAALNVIASSGFPAEGLYSMITDGGSQAMELMLLGVTGPAGSAERPLLLIDAAYANYRALAQRLGRSTVSIKRHLHEHGQFALPDLEEIEERIVRTRPGALLVIPYDNPTGHLLDHQTLVALAELCVEYNLWLVSDEAYRELSYTDQPTVSIWGLSEEEVPGIAGRRISIESASKMWNACGLRIGALVTDSKRLHEKAVAEYTANLCANAIGQYIYGALAHVSHQQLSRWYARQRSYYAAMMRDFTDGMRRRVPGIIVSSPDAAIYSVLDVRNVAAKGFDAEEFVRYCATLGKAKVGGEELTLLVAPMAGFYSVAKGGRNPGRTQMRVAYVETPETMRKVPTLFAKLLRAYEEER